MAAADTAHSPYKVIGSRPVRHDGADKVTGRAKYGADIRVTGMLAGAMLRSPHAHARIKSIDTSAAEALPGVHAVVTSADMPNPGDRIAELGEGSVNLRHLSANVLAREKVLYKGHAIAAVAADNIHIAEEAAALIRVDYELLPLVLDVRQAMQDDAPVLNHDVRTEEFGEIIGKQPSNVARRILFEQGDVAGGFAKADVVIEREFVTSTVHQGYIEPHTATAVWHGDGRLTIYASTQGSFTVRHQVSELLGLPMTLIKVVPMEIGGGFGGKISVYVEPVTALLAEVRTSGEADDEPGRCARSDGTDAGVVHQGQAGGDKGREARRGRCVSRLRGRCLSRLADRSRMHVSLRLLRHPGGAVEGYDVCVNKPRTNAYRAPGSTNAAFAMETVVEELCKQLGVCSLDFRLKNAAKEGTRRVDGIVYPRIGLVETLEAIRNSDHWNTPLEHHETFDSPGVHRPPHPARGRGVACGFWFNAGLKSSVTVNVNSDGKVSLIEGSTDIGGTRTSLAMQLAETLGIAAEDINPIVADTDGVGYTDVTGGSRVTLATGLAAYEAGLKIRAQMCQAAAHIWECDPSNVSYEDGGIHGPEGRTFTFAELAGQVIHTGEPITASASISAPASSNAFGTHCVDVEVDVETGKVSILRYTIAQDAGTAIHPAYVEGQMQGGVAQGIGWALNEEYVYGDDGRMRNASYLDYRMPTCFDLPMIETIIVEVPNPDHPYGVRGVGEVPICPPPAALGAAIFDAIGVRMQQLPMSPPRVLHEILKR